MAIEIENQATFDKILKRKINLFVGSGFSVLAKDANKKTLPIGADLANELCDVFDESSLRGAALPQISQILKSRDKQKFNNFLLNRFRVEEFDERYNRLTSLPIGKIITTNIDDLFYKIFSNSVKKYLNDVRIGGASFADFSAVDYIPLHGSVLHPDVDFAFTPVELATAFSDNPSDFTELVLALKRDPILFLGYSLSDSGVLQAFGNVSHGSQKDAPKWIQVRDDNYVAIAYFKSLGFNIIKADTSMMLDYLSSFVGVDSIVDANTLTSKDFVSGSIPTIDKVPVRSMVEFYKGQAPIWHDIIVGRRIPILSRYSQIENMIDSGRNVLITGVPVCGKSTLLMQMAAFHTTERVKLFETHITIEKANHILRVVRGRGKVLLFIDNVADSVDSLDLLSNSGDIQIVGADRDVDIGYGSHRFNKRKFTIIDCSALEREDYSPIYEAIPDSIRLPIMRVPDTASQTPPSTFEFIAYNVSGPSIEDRYESVLESMRKHDRNIHDVFVMICYVYTCHSPVSFDVLSNFINAKGDYEKVYDVVESLGKLLSEVDFGDQQFINIDADQDHFVPRSRLVSEIVVAKCPDIDFSRMFKTFHEKVSPRNIPRFGTFRRYGFRSALVDRVFHDWEDGEKFYLSAYNRDKSFFLKQQLAIYLGIREQYAMAFKYIDEALAESKNRNANIKHTHARLLFDANLMAARQDPALRRDLELSMDILETCHKDDKRQLSHAIRFAQQGLKYRHNFPGEQANNYIKKAREWISEELKGNAVGENKRHLFTLQRQLDRDS